MDHSISRVGSRQWPIFAILFFICCAVLLWTNHRLQVDNADLHAQLENLASLKGPAPGSTIATLRGQAISGEDLSLNLADRRSNTLLFIFSPVCKFCKENLSNWQTLMSVAKPDRVVWADVTGKVDATYQATASIPPAASIIRLNPEERTLYAFDSTPTTVLLSKDGTVIWRYAGVLEHAQIEELRKLL